MKRSIEPTMARCSITGCARPLVFGDVFGAQALRHHEVDLHRAALPGAAERVLQVVFDLRAVERALARQLVQLDAAARAAPRRSASSALSQSSSEPTRVVRPQSRACRSMSVKPKSRVDLHAACAWNATHSGSDLVLGAEDVAVVLREAAHAHDAVQRAGRLVAVARAELAVAQRQVAVAAQAAS